MDDCGELTKGQFEEILLDFYKRGIEAERVKVKEFVNEIIQKMTFVMNQSDY